MKILFILYISTVGPTYDYTAMASHETLAACTEQAREWSVGGFHAYCAKENRITQVDPANPMRPQARPEGPSQ